ncbi:MAG: 50S ribosomal protein L32e [Candidatus Bathyarchaeia archaeon]
MSLPKESVGSIKKTLLKRRVRKPDFLRQESWRYKRLDISWRRPRGLDSKMRLKRKGWPASPNVGYRSPKKLRGLHPSGYREILVKDLSDLIEADPKYHVIRISHTIGKKKAIQISSKAYERGLVVLNPPEAMRGEVEKGESKEST